MSDSLKEHLEHVKFDRYLKKLYKRLKNKSVIVYGSGALFQYIVKNYDLSKLNILGVSDMKFTEAQEGKDFLGYKVIPKSRMKYYEPDVVLVATLKYLTIIEDFALNIFNNTKTKIYPLAKMPLWDLIKDIWSN